MSKLRRHPNAVATAAIALLVVAGWVLDLPLVLVLVACLAVFVAMAARDNGAYVRRKLVTLIPILAAVTFISFIAISLMPGDLAVNILGPGATEQGVAELRERLHLDDPVLARYFRWVGDAATGDLGESPVRNEPVAEGLGRALPISLQLMVYAQIIALGGGLLLGVLSAYREGTRLDRAINGFSSFFLSMPGYVLGPLLVLFFAVGGLRWFGASFGFSVLPAARYVYFGDDPVGHFRSILLPALTLSMSQMAAYARLLRTDMVATLKEDFINVAKAKGMGSGRILFSHALRPSSFTLLTVLGINIGFLIGNALIVETIFTLPGVGTYIATAIFQRDYLAIQGGVVVLAVGYVLANFVVDLLYAILDPRVRHARAIV